MEYDLPEDWDLMTIDERIEWHAQRVEKEEPIFQMLEDDGVFSCFEPEELRIELAMVRAEKRRVEAALILAQDEEFQGLWQALGLSIQEANLCTAERARILNLQMRRKNFASYPEEEEQLAALKVQWGQHLDEAEEMEGEIIKLCDKYGVDPSPYLVVDDVRENR